MVYKITSVFYNTWDKFLERQYDINGDVILTNNENTLQPTA